MSIFGSPKAPTIPSVSTSQPQGVVIQPPGVKYTSDFKTRLLQELTTKPDNWWTPKKDETEVKDRGLRLIKELS